MLIAMTVGERDMGLEFRLLGPLEVVNEGSPLPLGGPRQRALLALLLLHANQAVSRDRLVDGLWGDRPPETAANALQVAVHGLRKLLGRDRIVTRGVGYLLRVEPGELDLDRFRELAAAGLLREALALWRGEALADLQETPFGRAESARLEEARIATLEDRIDADLELGHHADLVGEVEALIDEHPYRERLRGHLMVALYRSGRQAEALDTYQRTRAALVDQLGVEPSPALQELERAILRHDPSLVLRARAMPTATNLPAPATALVGRELELTAVTALLRRDDVRLLTLSGPGGMGKTRLALEVGAKLLAEFPDGVFFVDLAPLDDASLVSSTIAHVIGAGEGESSLIESLKTTLKSKAGLLLLDNFERVDEAASIVSELLATAPRLKVLVTSRAVLHLSGEHEYAVPPLRTPPEHVSEIADLGRNEAVALFVARARAVRHDFRLSEANAAAVAGICVALDGLPLALELAAARVRMLTPVALLERLEQRLEVLTGGPRDVPARQQTLRATIDWSYELLDLVERRLFATLAVFAGGFTPEAAEAICGDAADSLAALVDKSLLQRDETDVDEPRFRMLETVREYALERLEANPEADAIRRGHAAYFLSAAEEAGRALWGPVQGPEQVRWLDRLEADHDNFRTALAWSDRNHSETQLRLATSLFELWENRSYLDEGRHWLERSVARGSDLPAGLRAKALHCAAYLALFQGDHVRGNELGETSLALYRELGDKEGAGRTVHILSWGAVAQGDLGRAETYARESLSLARELGHTRGVIVSLGNLGELKARQGDRQRAAALLEEGLELAKEHGDRTGAAGILVNRSELAVEQGDHEEAARMLAESLTLYGEHGHTRGVANCVHKLALLAEARGRRVRAVRLFGAAERMRETIGTTLSTTEYATYTDAVARARAALGEPSFTSSWAAGRALPLEQAVSYAVAHGKQAA